MAIDALPRGPLRWQDAAVRIAITLAIVALAAALTGCDVTKFTANSAADVFDRASPGIEEHWDYDFVGKALPAQIMQIEGLLRVSPENQTLLLNGARAYASYSFGWVDDAAERLTLTGDSDGAEAQRERAVLLYDRAARLGRRYMELHYGGFDEARAGGIDGFRSWLHEELDDPEDAAAAWWVGYAWGLHVNAVHPHEADPERDYAIAMVSRSVELDSTYYGASGLALLAFVATQRPHADLDAAEAAWNRALQASGRTNLLVLVTMARTYAVKRHDRTLYVSLLREVIHAGDVRPAMRLSNKVARHRAIRYLGEVDRLFPPAEAAAD